MKDLEGIWRKCTFAADFTKNNQKTAAMQRQKLNISEGLNIQSTWCVECDSYMHTSSIAAPRYSDWKSIVNALSLAEAPTSFFWSRLIATFHIARGGSGLLPT